MRDYYKFKNALSLIIVSHLVLCKVGAQTNYSDATSKGVHITNKTLLNATVCTDPGINPGDTGCINFTYDGIATTVATVRGADGNIWLQQNLGSSQVATAMTDTNSYGDIYQWGRWNDGHEKRTSTTTSIPNPNNPSGITSSLTSFINGSSIDWWDSGSLTDSWSILSPTNVSATDGCDPCKALGAGWVMPTESDWTGIKNAENITNPTTAYASNLKLPASGYRSSSTGNFTFVGQRGYYWSATTSILGGKYFYIGTTIANSSAGAMRGQGHAVRCIYKGTTPISSVTITTQNNVPATIATLGGTLQLNAAIVPVTSNQNVIWSVQSGNLSASVNTSGQVIALANGTATIRATSIADPTKFGEITVTINTPCTAVQTFLEDFSTFTIFPENCWNSNYTNFAVGIDQGTLQLYSGGATGDIIIVSPEVSTIDGQHILSFDISSISQSGTTLQIGTMSDNMDFSTFLPFGASFTPIAGTSHTSTAIPANTGHKYIAVKYISPSNSHIVLKLDNIEWKPVTAGNTKFDSTIVKIYPNPTTGTFLIDTEITVKSVEIYNALGQCILKTNQRQINLEKFDSGLYILNIYTHEGNSVSHKLIKK